MPIQESDPSCKIERIQTKKSLTKNEALHILREKEVLAYHNICEVFRAQGHLTPEKLKLLKEIAAALYIPDVRHHTACWLASNNRQLKAIADCVAGPGSETEWKKEGVDPSPPIRPGRINSASLRLADAVAAAFKAELEKLGDIDENTVVTKTVMLESSLFERDFNEVEEEEKVEDKPVSSNRCADEITKDDDKEDDKDGDSSSRVSLTTEEAQYKEEENKPQQKVQEITAPKEDPDTSLMPPPPPPVTFIPPPRTVPPTPPVITVPPPSDMTVVTEAPTAITVPETPIVETPVSETPLLSEAQAQAQADFFSSLPPLVVVPPPDPSETSTTHSPSPSSPALVLSPGMSIQIRDDTKKRKRSLSLSQETVAVTGVSTSKTVALSSYPKMTPVMVSTAASITSQAQVKVTPIISRAKMSTTAQPQKVIIVSNTPTTNTPILQRSLNVPMGSLGFPIMRTNRPRFQQVTAQGGGGSTVRPKMVTVPARCRAKGSSMVNLQLKNAITLKQDNVTVVDTSVKRLPGPTKILPKPSGSMFIVNTGPGTHKLSTTMGGGRVGTNESNKQNVVLVQKGPNQRTLTLSNPNKDLMQKLMSKKCVVIQSSKMVPKTISPKPPAPPLPVTTTAGNVVVLDLSQEQYRQNLSGTTLAEILQASGIITSPSQPVSAQNPILTEAAQVSSGEGEWLPVETSKSLSLEEVSLPLGQSESFVTLDEAVEMLEDRHTESVSEGDGFTSTGSEQVFTITPDQLSSGNLTVMADKSEPTANQIVIETLPPEIAPDLDCMPQTFSPHKDGAVTIQHSNIVPLGLLFLTASQSYPTGAPQDVCETLDPSAGHGSKPQKTAMPFHLTTDVTRVDSNGHVFFRIRAKPPATFLGFMVQAIGEREEKPIGIFTDVDDEDVKLLECFGKPDNTATHANNEPKEEIVLRWVPDNDYSGKVFFTATVLKTMKEYWVRKTAKPVTVQRAKA